MQIEFGYAVGIGHIVLNRLARAPVGAGPVFPGPADCRIDRHICDVDALRREMNEDAVRDDCDLISLFQLGCGEGIWIATDDYRRFTAVMTSSERNSQWSLR